jgi:hypothetical protein
MHFMHAIYERIAVPPALSKRHHAPVHQSAERDMKNKLRNSLLLAGVLLLGAVGPALADSSCGADTIGLDMQSWPFLEAALQQSAAVRGGDAYCAPPAIVGKLRIEAAGTAPSVASVSRRITPCDTRISEGRCGRNEMLDRVVPVEDAGLRLPEPPLLGPPRLVAGKVSG